jgi:hypothetical protein
LFYKITFNLKSNGYRLPTEAEWEYAARGGNKTQNYTYSGSENLDEIAWYSSNSSDISHQVGSKKPNEIGIYDMTGNVREWCWDWFRNGYFINEQNNPVGPSTGEGRVFRGGNCFSDTNELRCANRGWMYPNYNQQASIGFRIARSITSGDQKNNQDINTLKQSEKEQVISKSQNKNITNTDSISSNKDLIDSELQNKDYNHWIPSSMDEYQAVYNFGESDGGWNLILYNTQNKWYGQISSGEWTSEGKWLTTFTNLKNVSISDNHFISDTYSGDFVTYNDEYGDNELKYGLKLKDSDEYGYKSYPLDKYYFGRYPDSSFKVLDENYLNGFSKDDLKIMRNEIYARYGYIFTPGGEMEAYFAKQEWYSGIYKDVTNFLTEVEMKNIALIQKAEKSK